MLSKESLIITQLFGGAIIYLTVEKKLKLRETEPNRTEPNQNTLRLQRLLSNIGTTMT